MRKRLSVMLAAALASALTLVAVGVVPVAASEGCTPGYWKQSQHFDSWPSGYMPNQDFDTVFTNVYIPSYVVNLFDPNITLLQALQLQGDKTGIPQLARAATAALLNAEKFGDIYPGNVGWIKLAVYYASEGASKSVFLPWKDTMDRENNTGCPLN